MTLHTTTQGGRKFEISWEPNFPVNDCARNNGKNRVIFKTIINIMLEPRTRLGRNTQSRDQCTDSPCPFGHWTQKIKYGSFFKTI